MKCARCSGLLVDEFIVDPIEGSQSGFHGRRCLNCGTIVDEVIGENRTISLSRQRHPVKSRPRFRFDFTNYRKRLTKREFRRVSACDNARFANNSQKEGESGMATNDPKGLERRRSQRISLAVDLYAVSLDPSVGFRGRLNTVQVSRHGCLLTTRRPFRRGTLLRLELFDTNRSTTAQVVHSDPTRTYTRMWNVALELGEPGNFWGIDSPPQNLEANSGEV